MVQAPARAENEPSAALLADRYGRRPDGGARRLRARVLIGVLAAVGIAVLVWIAVDMFAPSVDSRDVGFHVVDSESVRVTFDVTKPAERSAVCTLEALSTGYGQVGLLEVEIGPQPADTVRITSEVATSELATTGLVRACTLTD
ncbi:DUF4307 domain-containing protein [Occultella gossypii]|uniref:DUF4307 domain-containing protein n=1 Tax=Occultella gossypii TaxID=2800820 RepID=A0ABS7S919_9MICO|nr:DUF4307 domain-containing protein [Occultella gossypii]MBZ2196602.1 DUF4307 domain-containing protein [Occultella gossypii]